MYDGKLYLLSVCLFMMPKLEYFLLIKAVFGYKSYNKKR